jgi:hypothetical protein
MEDNLESGLKDERIKKALTLHYLNFDTEKSVTINEAASNHGLKGIEPHIYIVARTDEGLGMPETREEAIEYNNALLKL